MRSTAKFVIAYDINDKYSLFGRHNSRCSLPVNLGRPPLIKTKHFQLLQSSLQPTVTSSSIALFFFVFYSGAIRTRASCVFFFSRVHIHRRNENKPPKKHQISYFLVGGIPLSNQHHNNNHTIIIGLAAAQHIWGLCWLCAREKGRNTLIFYAPLLHQPRPTTTTRLLHVALE